MKAGIIGAGAESLHTIRQAQELGQEVIALDQDPEAAGLEAADHGYCLEAMDEDQAVRVLAAEKVDFLLTPPIGRILSLTGAVNDALALPGIGREAALLCTDKYLFHRRLQEHGLRNCFCYPAGRDEGRVTYPAVLKPRYGSGSKDIFMLSNEEDKSRALARLKLQSRNGKHPEERSGGDYIGAYIIEEAVAGTEYGVDGVLDGDRFYLVLLRKKLLTPLPARQAIGYLSVRNGGGKGEGELASDGVLAKEARLVRRVEEYLAEVTAVLGLADCLFHADLIIDDDRIFVIELSARPSGHYLHNIFTPLAAGVDTAAEYIKCRIGKSYHYQPEAVMKMMIRYFDMTGRAVRVPTEAVIERLLAERAVCGEQAAAHRERMKQGGSGPVRLVRWQCRIRPGDRLDEVANGHSLMDRGFFILSGGNDEELEGCGAAVLGLFETEDFKFAEAADGSRDE